MCAKPNDSSPLDMDKLRQEFEKLRSGLGDMGDKLGDSANAAMDQISDYLNKDKLSSHLSAAEEQLNNLGSRLRDTGKEAVAKLESEVSDKPFVALAIAFGVGLLAAGMIRR